MQCNGFLIPDVALIPFESVFAKEVAELVLEGDGLVVLFLIGDVDADGLGMAGADGEGAVAVLPVEVGQVGNLGFDPWSGFAFQLFDQMSDRDRAAEPAEDVDVVGDAADAEDGAIELVAFAAEDLVGFFADDRIVKPGMAVLRGEDDVDVDLGEGLGHGRSRLEASWTLIMEDG